MKKVIASSLFIAAMIGCAGKSYQPYTSSPSDSAELKVELKMPEANAASMAEVEIKAACPAGMIKIEGEYCPKDDAKCLYWVDLNGKKTNIDTDRCGEYRYPVHCLVPTKPMSYCIDQFKYPNKKGALPQDWLSFRDAEKIAKEEGKRLCTYSEYAFAALGPNNDPYPFGDHYHRDHSCNIDNHTKGLDVFKAKNSEDEAAIAIRKMQVPSGSLPNCVSSFGVHDMVGGVDSWVVNESGVPYISGLVGGHLFGVRNRSRAATISHSPTFYWYETGTTLCADVR